MRASDQIARFVGKALAAGRSREQIAQALTGAGWAPNEVEAALGAWADADFQPPVPRPRPHLSALDAYRYGLIFVALVVTAWHLVWLGWLLVDRWLPDPAYPDAGYYGLSEMRWSIAALLVFGTVFLILSLRSARATRADPGLRRSAVRKWLGYITLFLASITLLTDLLYTLYTWLNGDLSLRFLIKAAIVVIVAGLVFLYFRAETAEAPDEA